MDYFEYKNKTAYCEDMKLTTLAEAYGTPLYIYSKKTLHRHLEQFQAAFQKLDNFLPCYAVKASSSLGILREVFSQGFGADVVSIGELERSLKAGCSPDSIVFSGVGKTRAEIERGIEVGIYSFNIESKSELERVIEISSQLGKLAQISIRVNPNIDAKTNPYIATGLHSSKFGISIPESLEIFRELKNNKAVKLIGLSCHIGSQMTDLVPLSQAVESMVQMVEKAKEHGHQLEFLDMGGGLGIKYNDENPPSLREYAQVLQRGFEGTGLRLVVEPGRIIVGNTGILLTRVEYVKTNPNKTFVIVDAAMNDLLRPSIYKSYHEILPVVQKDTASVKAVDVVGPICESGDFFAKDRELVLPCEGEYLFIRSCGAYASSMAFNYNSRPKSCEVLVNGESATVLRRRESLEDLWRLEE